MPHSPKLAYRLGCPVWARKDWIGAVFPADTPERDLLRAYSRRFNTVEGNSLFYALPSMATVERWMAETAEGFRFAPKFPKAISHERRLAGADEETKAFQKVLARFEDGGRLGVSLLQLPPSFNLNHFDALESYLKRWPKAFPVAVEPRHPSWYDLADGEARLDDLLATLGAERAVFDTRCLFSQEPETEAEREAQQRKPKLPARKTALGRQPFVRLVGRDDLSSCDSWIDEWADVIAHWIDEGRAPYVFAHTPDDANAPYLARRLHEQIQKRCPSAADLPAFPRETQQAQPRSGEAVQLDLL